jgi:endonuclease G, mitochondrial
LVRPEKEDIMSNENEMRFSIPVEVTIRLGAGGDSSEIQATSSAMESSELILEAARPLGYYRNYKGYDVNFLGAPVALPVLTEEQRRNAAKNSDVEQGGDPTVLPYTHFSIVMNRRRQLAYYTVVNIDGKLSQDMNRGRDRWYFDSRIAESEQIGEFLYKRNALDRGHLVRRLDPVWGDQARRANDDTFHFTNCSPQHERFNQGQDLWQGIENYILDKANIKDKKVSVFTGPVMAEDDPLYKGVRLPLAFWKIIAYIKADGSLATAAYMLEQAKLVEDMLGLEAAFDAGSFRVSLEHIKERTGLDFDYLKPQELPLSHDGLEAVGGRLAIRRDYTNLAL